MVAMIEAIDGDVQMIDSSVVPVHPHGANVNNATEFIVGAAREED
jgi:hypothetical protein